MNITLIGSGRRVVAACFILVLAASIPAFTARAQVVRGIGAGGLVLDDSHGNTVSITSPVYSNPATGEYLAWKNAGFPELSWSIPIPPFTGAQSGFVYNGPLTPTTGPYPSTPFVLYWLYPNEPSISGDGNSGGPTGSWDYATPAELGVVTSTGTLGNNEAVVTNGTGSMTTITNGGTNTLLHGTTPPTWSAVSLSSDVSGMLPITSGGTGLTATPTDGQLLIGKTSTSSFVLSTLTAGAGITIGNAGGAITITNTGLSNPMTTLGDMLYENNTPAPARLVGSTTPSTKEFLTSTATAGGVAQAPAWGTISATDIPTLNQNTTGTAANVTGTVAVANGGTGDNTLTSGDLLLGNGASAVTAGPAWNGTTLTGNISGTASNVTGTVAVANGGTGDVTLTSGDLLLGNGTSAVTAGPAWNGSTLTGNISGNAGGTASNVTGTVAVANGGTGDNTLTSGDLLLGNGTSAVTAGPAWNGTTLTGNITGNASGTASNVTGTVAVANGGTGDNTLTSGDLLLGNGASAVTAGPAWNGTTLTGNITGNASGTASNVTGTVAVANGGTGDVTLTSGDLLLGNGTSAVTAGPAWNGTTLTGNISGNAGGTASNVTGTVAIANGGTGQTTASGAINALLPAQGASAGDFLTTNGTVASWAPNPSGSVTTVSVVTANGFAGTVANSSTTPAITISTGVTGILYGNGTSIAAATLGEYPTFNQNTTGTAANVTGTVAVANGGTGDNTLTSGDLLLGNGTSAVTAGPAWNGTTLTGNITGNASGTASNVTGTVAVANGGTGDNTLTSGDLLLGNGTSAVTAGPAWNGTTLTGNISGNAGGTASNVTGTVAIANGGTGQTTASGAINALLPAQGASAGDFLTTNGTVASWAPNPSGSVTTVSVVTANGFAGTVANSSTTPAITISTGVTGILYGNGTSIAAATLGEYPTFNQNTTGTAANVTGTVAVANGGTGLATIPIHSVLIGEGTSNVGSATPSSGSSGYVLTSNGNGSDPTWQAPAPSAKGVDYDINTGSAQATAESDSALFDVGYASGAAITPGAFINTVNSGSGTATGLTVSAAGGTTNNAIVTTFNPTSSSTGISINGTTTASTGGSFGLLIGTTHAPDIAAKLEGVTGDLFTAGGLTSTAAIPAYSIKLAGSTTDNTDHSGAAIGVTGPNYTNGIFAQGLACGIYGVTTATTVIPVSNSDYDFNGPFTGSFGVRGEAVGTASEARVIGVWGLASGNSATNTSSIGVLAQGGNGETTAGATNVALDVENGELTMGRTTIATGDTGTYIVTSGISEGPSGEDSIPTSFASESGPYVQKESFSVGNEYCAANSIVLVTVENDPDANSAYMAQAIPQKGYFKLILTQSVVNSVSSSADPKVKIGYIIINPSR